MATLNNLLVSGSTTHLNPIKVTTSEQTTTETMAFVSSAGASSRSGFGAIRTDTGLKTFFGTNVGGDRIGIYDDKNTRWILRADASGNITYTGGNVEGDLHISNSNSAGISVTNTTQPHKATFISSAGTAGLYDDTNSKWIVLSNSSGKVSLNGNAMTAEQIYSTRVHNTPSQAYSAIPFTQTSLTATGNKELSHSADAFGFMASSTVAGTEGYAILVLGNNIAQATANNKRGRLRLYGNTTYYHDIYAGTSAQTANISLTLPNGPTGGWLVGASGAGVGGSAIPVYVNSSGVVTACKVNASGSWHNNGLAVQTGAALEMGKYIDFHEATSTNDYDARISSSLTGVWISTRNAQVVGNENLRNIKAATTDLTAGSSALPTGVIYLVYE